MYVQVLTGNINAVTEIGVAFLIEINIHQKLGDWRFYNSI